MGSCKATKSLFYHPSEALPATKVLQNVTVTISGVLISVFVNEDHFKLNFKDISDLNNSITTKLLTPREGYIWKEDNFPLIFFGFFNKTTPKYPSYLAVIWLSLSYQISAGFDFFLSCSVFISRFHRSVTFI
jgi:hypothetical protein